MAPDRGRGGITMGIIFLLSLGMVAGFLCGLLRNANRASTMTVSIAIGVAAALFSGLALPPLFGFPSVAQPSSLMPASIGTAIAGTMIISIAGHVLLQLKR